MYAEIKDGKKIKLHGLNCWIPPVGYGYHIDPEQAKNIELQTGLHTPLLEKTDVLKRSSKKEEQYWERPVMPEELNDWRAEELERQRTEPNWQHPELMKIVRREWNRRRYGVWFYNDGVPTYITGSHYFYLTHWKIDIGYPKYRKIDKEYFYFWQYCYEDPKCTGAINIEKRRNGKCFEINTLIRMYDGGVKKVQDIKDGEFVMGNDSTPRLVYGCTSGEEEMYEIVPNKGDSFTVNKSHIIYCYRSINIPGVSAIRVPEKYTVAEYLELPINKRKNLLLERVGWGDEYNDNKHIVDPYFLGVWLGDGDSKCLSITNQDEEIVDYLKVFSSIHGLNYKNFGEETPFGYKLKHYLGNLARNTLSYTTDDGIEYFDSKQALMRSLGKHIKTPLKTFGKFIDGSVKIETTEKNVVWDEFKRMGIANNKHIPKEYLIDSKDNRLQLLAGLLDSDGHLYMKDGIPKHFSLTFSTKYQALIDDSITLIRSLGFYCGVKKLDKVNAVSLTIFGDIHIIPTKVIRKQAIEVERKYNSRLTGFFVRPKGVGTYYGFAVDDNHLFLLADGTVVHNTYRSCCILYEVISRTANSIGGIQSKTDEDAEAFFQKKLVPSFMSLPYFFIPEYDTSKGDMPKGSISFFRTSKKGKQQFGVKKVPALQSTIGFRNRKPKAYDGEKLKIYIGDESGKVDINVIDRHQVLNFCVKDEQGRVIGKMLITSTVEEMGVKFGFDRLWQQSNQFDLTKNGTTKSGMYKLFTSAIYSGAYDIYGEPDIDGTVSRINSERALAQDSIEELNGLIRKEPMTEEEAFFVSAKRCHFNPQELNYRLSDLSVMKNYSEIGNFSWVERDKRVIWTKEPSGKWEICWLFEGEGQSNNVMKRGTKFIPNNELYFITGCDPFDHDQVEDDSSRSKGAAFTLMRHNPYKDETPYNNAFVCKYHARPELAHIFYEDMIMQCFYYGSKLLVENQKPGIMKYFDTRGYKDFLVHFGDRKEPGIPSSPENKILMLEATQLYLKDNTNKVFFKDLIGDWLKFDISNTQKYDLSMAAGWTLFANTYNAAKKGSSGLKDITKLFRRYAA